MRLFVPTDLSKESAEVVKYAIKLSKRNKHELIFFYSYAFAHVADLFSKSEYKALITKENELNILRLGKFITKCFEALDEKTEKFNFKLIVNDGLIISDDIITNSKKQKSDIIIAGTHGASGLEKMVLGTNTAVLIKKSKIPVLSVPINKKTNFNSRFILACDKNKLPAEFKWIEKITSELGLQTHLVHFNYANEKSKVTQAKLTEIKANVDLSLIENIEHTALKQKMGGVIMITQQNRSWFERLFLSSKTSDMSFRNKLPVLSFPAKG